MLLFLLFLVHYNFLLTYCKVTRLLFLILLQTLFIYLFIYSSPDPDAETVCYWRHSESVPTNSGTRTR